MKYIFAALEHEYKREKKKRRKTVHIPVFILLLVLFPHIKNIA